MTLAWSPFANASAILAPGDVRYRPKLEQVEELNGLLRLADPHRDYGTVSIRSTVRLKRAQLLELGRDLRRYREAFFDFFDAECQDPGPLNILVLPLATLNDARNFGRLRPGVRRLGAYHGASRTIYLTPDALHSGGTLVLAHELAHHYYSVCRFTGHGEMEHVRIYAFQNHITRRSEVRWPSERKTIGGVSLPGVGDVSFPITVQSERAMTKLFATRLANRLRARVSEYARIHQEELRCQAPWPLRIRFVPWRGFSVRSSTSPRPNGHYFRGPSELYLPDHRAVSPQVLAREAAWLTYALCSTQRPADPTDIDHFARSAGG